MELNLCAACGAFVNRDWTVCRSCAASLIDETAITHAEPQQQPEQVPVAHIDAVVEDHTTIDSTNVDAPSSDATFGLSGEMTEPWVDSSQDADASEPTQDQDQFQQEQDQVLEAEPAEFNALEDETIEDEWEDSSDASAPEVQVTEEELDLAGRLSFPSFQSTFDPETIAREDTPVEEGPAEAEFSNSLIANADETTDFGSHESDIDPSWETDPDAMLLGHSNFQSNPFEDNRFDIEQQDSEQSEDEEQNDTLNFTSLNFFDEKDAEVQELLNTPPATLDNFPSSRDANEADESGAFLSALDLMTTPGPDYSSVSSMIIGPVEKKPNIIARLTSQFDDSTLRKGGRFAAIAAGAIVLLGVLALIASTMFKEPTVPTTVAPPAQSNAAGEWRDYADPDGLYTALLPGTPTPRQEPAATTVRADIPGTTTYVETYIRRIPANRNRALDYQLMANQLTATARDRGATATSQSQEVNNGVRQLNGHFASADLTVNGDAVYYVRGDILYGMWLVSPSASGEPDLFARLVGGFRPNA